MRLSCALLAAAAAALLAATPGQAAAAVPSAAGSSLAGSSSAGSGAASQPCAEASTNLEVRACLAQRVVEIDRQLITALQRVQRQAMAEPSAAFRSGWSELLDSQAGGSDPAGQLQRFQNERRRICLYAQSISFQGSGYGGFVSSCELALTQTLLQQLRGE